MMMIEIYSYGLQVWEIAEGDVPESVFRGGASSIGE